MSAITVEPSTRRSSLAGTMLVLGSAVAWSCSGLFSRLLTTDPLTAVALRSLFGGGFLFLLFAATNGRATWRNLAIGGWPGIVLVIAQVICQACTVTAFFYTSVANVAVIYATAPFMAAGLAFWLIRERMRPRTMLACAVAFAGVALIVSGGLGQGGLSGDLQALVMTASFAAVIAVSRAYPDAWVVPSTIWSAAITFACFLPFSHPLTAGEWNVGVLAAFGFTNFTLAMSLFLAGSRRIAAAQAALIGTLDAVLSPFWVWLAFGEVPSTSTFMGGGLIFGIVVWHILREWQGDDTVHPA